MSDRPRSAPGVLLGRTGCGLVQGPGEWLLAPEGAAVLPHGRLAVIADVHLGYEWARGATGDVVPAHSLRETIAKLDRLFTRTHVRTLVIAGDLVESSRPCERTTDDVARLERWLSERGADMVWLRGNHDPCERTVPTREMRIDSWTVAHGHQAIRADRVIVGHFHPLLRSSGVVAPSFLVSERLILLPAFSMNAAGIDCTRLSLPPEWLAPEPRCIAGLGETLLDFGPLGQLARKR